MQARGPLMIEHRLIEKMITVIQKKLEIAGQTLFIDPYFVDTAVDFIRIYADRTHHGKEEDILFSKLKKKKLSDKDNQLMDELIKDHMLGRKTTQSLSDANARYHNGDSASFPRVIARLKTITEFYPKHIMKEDNIFFPASRNYFTAEEDREMLSEFREFDRKMIHEKYEALVADLELK
ncbi:MAG: hemerythrin domain-containing protein [Spirochaetota bacterium]